MSAVYHTLLPRIGVLSSRKVRVVMYAYLTDDTLLKSLILLGKRDGDYVSVDAGHAEKLKTMFASVLPHLNGRLKRQNRPQMNQLDVK